MAKSVFFFFILIPLLSLSILASSQHDELLYEGFGGSKRSNLTLSGIAEIGNNGILRLTNSSNRLMGHAFYPSPLRFKNSNGTVNSFSTCFALAIVPEFSKLGGHGLTFAVVRSIDFRNAFPSQYFGLLNRSDVGNFSNHLFAIEFDTVTDFSFGDIDDNHVGIDINGMRSNQSASAAYYSDDSVMHRMNLKGGRPILCWVDYDSVKNLVNVTISPFSSKPPRPLLSFRVDLSPIFKEKMYVGFSASTGLLASSHYILGWTFKMNGVAKSLNLDSLPSVPVTKTRKKNSELILSLSLLGVAVFIASIYAVVYLILRAKNAEVIEPWELEVGPHRYPYKQLKKATRGFKDSELLGFGGSGRVYMGTLPKSKTRVAVKKISHEATQGLREFMSEVSSIGRLRHRNLVQLLGWSKFRGDLLLVYDFMPNGSLEKLLYDQPKSVLRWKQRFKVIKDVAAGLLYLHEGYEKVVIHRDIKASNVLLDGDLNARVGDFGLARLHDHGSKLSTTRVVGTMGYLAPELGRTGKSSEMTDVFAFGTLLLEIVCGRRPVEYKSMTVELVLVDWVSKNWAEGRILDVVDPNLKREYDVYEVTMVLKLGLMCSDNVASARPSMRQVVAYLEGESQVPEVSRSAGGSHCGVKGDNDEACSQCFDDNSTSAFATSTTASASASASPLLRLWETR